MVDNVIWNYGSLDHVFVSIGLIVMVGQEEGDSSINLVLSGHNGLGLNGANLYGLFDYKVSRILFEVVST